MIAVRQRNWQHGAIVVRVQYGHGHFHGNQLNKREMVPGTEILASNPTLVKSWILDKNLQSHQFSKPAQSLTSNYLKPTDSVALARHQGDFCWQQGKCITENHNQSKCGALEPVDTSTIQSPHWSLRDHCRRGDRKMVSTGDQEVSCGNMSPSNSEDT